MSRRGLGARPVAGAAGVATLLLVVSATGALSPRAPGTQGPPPHSAGALALLAEREAILQKQLAAAQGAARERARRIYRLSRLTSYDASAVADASLQRARVLGLGAVALRRDIDEARLIEAELERVRAERRLLSLRAAFSDASEGVRPSFGVPLAGSPQVRFGVGKDPETGALVFSPGVRFRTAPGAAVRAVGPGTVRRIVDDPGEGQAVVVAHADGWTSVLTGLGSVAVTAGAAVHRGDVLGAAPSHGDGRVTLELWQGPSPVDPSAVIKLP